MSASSSQRLETLCTLACGIPDSNAPFFRKGTTSQSKEGKRTPEILDSLASLAICDARRQEVAVGVTITPEHVTLHVAQNHTVPQKVITHLQDIVARVKELRSLEHNISRSPNDVFSDNGSDTKKLEGLESLMIAHAWLKIRQRFDKRYDHFKKLLRFVLHDEGNVHAEAVDQVPFHTLEYRKGLLENLRHSDVRTYLVDIEEVLHDMSVGLKGAATSTKHVQLVRVAMQDLRALHSEPAVDRLGLGVCELCTLYFGRQEKGFNMDRWIQKITTTRANFLRVARLVTSKTLASFIDADIKVVSVEPQPDISILVDITRETIRQVAQEAGWKQGEAKDGNGELIGDVVLDQFFLNLANNLPAQNSKEVPFPTKLQRNFTKVYPHCECTLLAHLDGQKGLHPYIGVSKLSCALCSECFVAYREHTNLHITTRGCRSQVVPGWVCPFPETSVVRQKMREAILRRILCGLQALELAEKSARQLPQSTVASGDVVERRNLEARAVRRALVEDIEHEVV